MIEILDINHPTITEFSSLKINKSKDYIIADSEKVVLKLISSPVKVLKILASKDWLIDHSGLLDKETEVYYAEKSLLEKIVGHKLHHGVMAMGSFPKYKPLESCSSQVLVLNGVTSPENVGSIMRTAAAFGINSIVFDSKSCSPYLRRAIRVSMGNVFSLEIHEPDSIEIQLRTIKELGFDIYGAANEPGAIVLDSKLFKNKTAIVIGSEGHGLDEKARGAITDYLKIPIDDDVAHINAANAAAIFLYELSKNN